MAEIKVPKISVIVAAYNQEKFIGRCLRSLLHQTLPHSDYEIIVVNDGSNDLTGYSISQFVDPFDSVVKIVENEKNLGLPGSLNKALNFSMADLIVRVDADDYVNSNFLHFLSFYLMVNSDASAVACDYILVNDKEKVLKRCSSLDEPIACGIMFRKDALFDIGLYDEQFLSNEDKELRVRFEKKYKVDHLMLPLYRYRKHDNNMTNDTKQMGKYDAALKAKHKL